MTLDEIRDQPQAVALLSRALATGRLGHAYAFVGPSGSGRTTAALAFAAALLCEGPAGHAACGRCRGCRAVAARQHPDLHVVEPTPPERNPKGPRAIRIADVREVERRASLRPAMAARKVFVLDEAERMTEDAPQAFLKTLEEPPSHTVIVLVLSTVRALPATVLSRCQLVRFHARPGAAVSARRAEARALFAEVRAKGPEALFRRLQTVDRAMAEGLVDAYWFYCRDLVVAGAGGGAALLVNDGAADETEAEAVRWSLDELLAEIRTCREARDALATNVTPRLTLEVVLSGLARRAA